MIKRWHNDNPDDVLATFAAKEIIEKILAQPDCTVLRMFYAINDFGIKQLVIVGADINGKNILNFTSIGENVGLIKKKAIVADRFCICPPSYGQGCDVDLGWN